MVVVIICGLPGVGKTTLATQLAPLISAVVLSTDKIRKELFRRPSYSFVERRLVYDVMLLMAKYLHEAGISCILDATFNRERSRNDVAKRLSLTADQFRIVECSCPESIAISRLNERTDPFSDADIRVYQRMKKIYDPVRLKHIAADTTLPPDVNAQIIAEVILEKSLRKPREDS